MCDPESTRACQTSNNLASALLVDRWNCVDSTRRARSIRPNPAASPWPDRGETPSRRPRGSMVGGSLVQLGWFPT